MALSHYTDIIAIALVSAPIAFFYVGYVKVIKQGFFCHDATISYPYKEDETVSSAVLYGVGISVGLAVVIISELSRHFQNVDDDEEVRWYCYTRIPGVVREIYIGVGVFIFGLCLTELTTDIIKSAVGRKRPCFLDVCMPDFDCSEVHRSNFYVTDYRCTNEDIMLVNDMRLSFPSGHSSIASFTMLYSAIYLHKRLVCSCCRLVKYIFEWLFVTLAILTGITRLTDNRHHVTDVIGGIALGVLITEIMFLILVKRRNNKWQEDDLEKSMGKHRKRSSYCD